jgi:hypothetical protein
MNKGEFFMRRDDEPKNEISVLAPNGLGYGEGAISTTKQIENGELTLAGLQRAIELVRDSPTVFVEVDADALDDGCGDGRPTAKVFRYIKQQGKRVLQEFNKSRRRAKVFGGGLIVASSMLRVIKGIPTASETVLGDRKQTIETLHGLNIEFGAHTDTNANGELCGCGAIDKYPTITRNVLQFRDGITSTLRALYGDQYADNEQAINEVFEFYETLVTSHPDYFVDAAGASTMNLIEDDGAFIKQLSDTHLEDIIVINDVEGTTFDQRAFDAELRELLGDDSVQLQAFTFDTWRGRMYADAMSQAAYERDNTLDIGHIRKKAYADFLIRSTLAVAATLTAGDLPVIGRTSANKHHYALTA